MVDLETIDEDFIPRTNYQIAKPYGNTSPLTRNGTASLVRPISVWPGVQWQIRRLCARYTRLSFRRDPPMLGLVLTYSSSI